ncbi:hypothetical protein PVAP13_5NG643600 [Panicum virgatum]|uniref:Uncharacterized protein n=1 Tax=Panicum virgatum TaxID=38727 RepID=A0A8T0SC36_PANVG|nr:hypothetical protein PVAP13_5NG643600 [Panicum virgatum]
MHALLGLGLAAVGAVGLDAATAAVPVVVALIPHAAVSTSMHASPNEGHYLPNACIIEAACASLTPFMLGLGGGWCRHFRDAAQRQRRNRMELVLTRGARLRGPSAGGRARNCRGPRGSGDWPRWRPGARDPNESIRRRRGLGRAASLGSGEPLLGGGRARGCLPRAASRLCSARRADAWPRGLEAGKGEGHRKEEEKPRGPRRRRAGSTAARPSEPILSMEVWVKEIR